MVRARHPGRHAAASFLHLTDWELLRRKPHAAAVAMQAVPPPFL
jgi:hypothetical protein